MKKIIFVVLLVTSMLPEVGILTSCKKKDSVKSLTQMVRDEKKFISSYIATHNLFVQEITEGQTDFTPNVFYKFSNGVYMNVLDKGGQLPTPEKTKVILRFKGHFFNPNPINVFDNLSKGHYQDTEILYVDRYNRGALHYELINPAPGESLNELVCEGIAFPLSIVGDGARVQLIIPFLVGPEKAYKVGYPMFCEEVRYEFIRE